MSASVPKLRQLYTKPLDEITPELLLEQASAYMLWCEAKKRQYNLPKAQAEFSKPGMQEAAHLRMKLLEAAAALRYVFNVPVEVSLYGECASFK